MSVFQDFIPKKSFEVAYALMRVAKSTQATDFTTHLERVALDMLRAATLGNFLELRAFLRLSEYYLRIGEGAGFIPHFSVQSVSKEAEELDKFVVDYMGSTDLDLKINLEKEINSIFLTKKPEKSDSSKADVVNGSGSVDNRGENKEVITSKPEEVFFEEIPRESSQFQAFLKNSSVDSVQSGSMNGSVSFGGSNLINSSVPGSDTDILSGNSAMIRQSAILGKIRQSSYCRLKDIQDLIPNSSERTLRYDLQKLIDQGSIERVGSGGPSSFYRVRRDA